MATDLDLFTDDLTATDGDDTRAHASNGAQTLPGSLLLALNVTDRDTIAELYHRPEGELRDEYALQALRIGVLALRQARGQVDGEVIQRESQRMLANLEHQLQSHAAQMQQQLAGSLKEYFDPQSGRFHERVERLIKQDGELEQVLRRQIGGTDSELCKTLLNHVGSGSPLLKLLTPDESQGLLGALRAMVDQQLSQQRERVLKEFSLDNKEGALARLVSEIIAGNGQLTCDLQTKIDLIAREFSFDNEASAIKRFDKLLADTRHAVNANLTLDDDASALSRLKKEVLGILESHHRLNRDFQEEVKVTLATMVARREESERSTRHGVAFEEAVCEFLHRRAQHKGDIFASTGMETGQIKNCKIGDFLIELGADCSAAGAKVVVEAKEKADYTFADARKEIEKARENRDAQIGLFIFSQRTAPPGLDPFSRVGNDVFVTWNAEDSTTDLYLTAGLEMARALCVRAGRQSEAQAADFTAIDAAILEIEKRSNSLEEITKWSETIRNNSDKILDHIRKARNSLERQIEILQERLHDLRQSVQARIS
ncbi:MAG: hypothetical protein WD894_23810 [Pirellulales bacterium]